MQTKKQKIWVEIDVGSKSFHAALDFPMLFEKQEETSVSDLPNREFKLTSAGVKSFLIWIHSQQSDFFARYSDDEQDDLPIIFIMEATGICSTKLTKLIYTSAPDSKIIVANPEPIKSFRISLNIKNKTDKSDAQVIARYGRERKPSTKQKMPEEFVQLRELSRTRSFLKDMCSKTAVPSIPVLQDLYDRLLVKGNTRMQARCAVMRKMLLILRGMVIADKKYDKNFKKI